MPNAKDVNISASQLKVMLVGDSGSGKSTFASTFPTPGFVFDFGGGEILSYRGKDFDYEQYPLTPEGWVKLRKDLRELQKHLKAGTRFYDGEGAYATIVVDNVSALTDLAMEKALQLDMKRSPTKGPIWNVHYGMVKNLVEGRLRTMLNFPCNLVVIAHLVMITDFETGAILGVEPRMTGTLTVEIPAYFSEVYYCITKREGGDTKWFVETVPINRNHGRSRCSGVDRLLPDRVENDYNEIMAYLTGAKVKQKPAIKLDNKKEIK